MNEDSASVETRLVACVKRHFGSAARVEGIERALGGGSNETLLFDVHDGTGAAQRLVLRRETYTGEFTPFIEPAWQFALLEAAHAHGVPVPKPHFLLEEEDGLGRAFVMARVEGVALARRIVRDAEFAAVRPRLAAECGEILAAIHAIDPTPLAFLEQWEESRDPLGAQRRLLDGYNEAHPALELGLRWLETHRANDAPRTLVHGDYRNGNFIVGPDGVRAVLDWECSHFGDPLEDHGWLCARSWRFGVPERPVGGFGERADLYEGYRRGGGEVDPERARYWEIYALVRWAIINLMQAHGHVYEGRRSVVFAACGRNVSEIEYDLLKTLDGSFS